MVDIKRNQIQRTMRLLMVFATAITLVSAGSRGYRSEPHHRHNRESQRDRRANLDYDDIETADQDQIERFTEESSDRTQSDTRKSNRIGAYSTVNSIQVAKNKAQRRHSKLAGIKDSEASGTQFEGAHYGAYAGGAQVQQIHTHELLSGQGLVPIYQNYQAPTGAAGNIVLTGGLGVAGLGDGGAHPQLLLASGPGGHLGHPHAGLTLANHPVGHGAGVPENDLGTDITKSVYVFSAPPDPFDYVPRQTLTKLPQRPQKHYQVLFINAPSPPPPQQHHVELGPPPELKTLVYVLVKKPQPPPAINFIKPAPPPHPHKPEVYFIRYKNRGAYGLTPSSLGPVEETLPVTHAHPGVQYAPIAPQEEIRGNIDYGPGPALPPQYESPSHPYELEGYHQDDSRLSASHVLSQRSSARELDAGVSGI